MSFDLFMTCFRNGEVGFFPRAAAVSAFAPIATEREPGIWRFVSNRGTLYLEDQPEIAGLTVNRPPGGDEFWTAVVEVLRQTPSVLYWGPGGAVVADASVVAHLPASFIESVGMPAVTTDIAEILELHRNS